MARKTPLLTQPVEKTAIQRAVERDYRLEIFDAEGQAKHFNRGTEFVRSIHQGTRRFAGLFLAAALAAGGVGCTSDSNSDPGNPVDHGYTPSSDDSSGTFKTAFYVAAGCSGFASLIFGVSAFGTRQQYRRYTKVAACHTARANGLREERAAWRAAQLQR